MSPRTDESNQKIRDERREQILRAALRVFARKGLRSAKITDIATEARISQGLVHHYFDSKEAVYTAVVERAMQGALRVVNSPPEAVNGSPSAPVSPWDSLVAICEMIREGLQRAPEYLLVIVQCLSSEDIPPKTRELVIRYGAEFFNRLVELIRAGQAAGQVVPGDPRELALVLNATIQGLVLTAFTGPLFFERADLTQQGELPRTETILRGLKV